MGALPDFAGVTRDPNLDAAWAEFKASQNWEAARAYIMNGATAEGLMFNAFWHGWKARG